MTHDEGTLFRRNWEKIVLERQIHTCELHRRMVTITNPGMDLTKLVRANNMQTNPTFLS